MTTATRPPIGEPVLDASKKEVILQLAAEGFSRRATARIVGCAPSTITRTAQRDRKFGVDLARAEETLKQNALRTLNRVILQDKYWRAVGWVAERLMPEKFGRRRPEQLSAAEVQERFREMGTALLEITPVADRREAAEKIATLLNELSDAKDPFTADDFCVEAASAEETAAPEKPAEQMPTGKAEEASAQATSLAETPIAPPVSPVNPPSVQHAPSVDGSSRPSPFCAIALRESVSAFVDFPPRAIDLLGRCTGAAVARGESRSVVGVKAKPKGKKRRPK